MTTMKKQYNKPATKVIELTYKHQLLVGSNIIIESEGVASDIGFGGEALDFGIEPE